MAPTWEDEKRFMVVTPAKKKGGKFSAPHDESKHHRDEGGKFAPKEGSSDPSEGGGEGEDASEDKPKETPSEARARKAQAKRWEKAVVRTIAKRGGASQVSVRAWIEERGLEAVMDTYEITNSHVYRDNPKMLDEALKTLRGEK